MYDFTVGTSINNVFNVGISLSVTDMYYDVYTENREDLPLGNNNFNLTNILETEGSGVGVKLGVIYRPTNELRLGLSYHSPTWYNMTDIYAAYIDHNVADYVHEDDLAGYKPTRVDSRADDRGYFAHDYKFKTPDKWTASAALVLGRDMILSVDYELTNYGNMKYSEASGYNVRREDSYDENANIFIKDDFKASSTVRTGLEYRFTPQFSGRLGYAWMQNPYESALKDRGDAVTVGSTTAYRIEGDANYFTGGFGYRFNRNFYADLAVVYKTQKDDLYSYSNVYYDTGGQFINAEPYELTNNSIRGLLTIGYKF